MTYYNNYVSPFCSLRIFCLLLTIVLMSGCGGKTTVSENPDMPNLSGSITEIDDHGNAVADLSINGFTELGWQLGDRLEVTFSTGQEVIIKYVENYSDVPDGEYLGRFSTTTGKFKIAINNGDLAGVLNLKIPATVILREVALVGNSK